MHSKVTVSIPATSANLGPGFDCLGLALGLRNQFTFRTLPHGLVVSISGEGEGTIPTGSANLVVKAAEAVFRRIGRRPDGLDITLENHVPVGSGLGSSATATLGGILAANCLAEGNLEEDEMLSMAVALEGHPDNVTPALFGGLSLIVVDGDRLVVEQIPVPELQVVVVLPHFELPTSMARQALPSQVPLSDAVYNSSRVGLLIQALRMANYSKLATAMDDRLHQPYRKSLIPGMDEALKAGRDAGAAGVALSGAGPAVIAISPNRHRAISQAISAAFVKAGLPSRSWILSTDSQGSQVVYE